MEPELIFAVYEVPLNEINPLEWNRKPDLIFKKGDAVNCKLIGKVKPGYKEFERYSLDFEFSDGIRNKMKLGTTLEVNEEDLSIGTLLSFNTNEEMNFNTLILGFDKRISEEIEDPKLDIQVLRPRMKNKEEGN